MLAVSLVMACGLSACRFSDTITQTFYGNEYEEIDWAATPQLRNTAESDNLREDLPAVSKQDAKVIRDESMTLALYAKDNTNSDAPARRPVYNKDAEPNGETDEKPVSAVGEEKAEGEGEGEDGEEGDQSSETSVAKSDKPSKGKEGKGGKGKGGKDGSGESGKGNADDGFTDIGGDDGGSGKGEEPVNDPTGEREQIRTVPAGTVICTGEIANAVAMLCGSDAMLATSESFTQNSANTGKLFQSDAEVLSRIKTLWGGGWHFS